MTWTKLSDDFGDDCDTLSDAAFRLHVEALVYSNRKLLDCRIPKDRLRRFATHPEVVAELLAVGWWTEDAGFYIIRHHAAYQRTREETLKQQEANRENGRKGGRPPKPPREQALASETQSVSESLSDSSSESTTQRDGTGQDRLLPGEPPTDVEPRRNVNGYGVGRCGNCLGFEKLGTDGLCSACCVSSVTAARAAS